MNKENNFSENKLKTEKYHEDISQEIKNIADFDYDIFKKRNKDIQNKTVKEIKIQSESKKEEKENFLDEKTLNKLQELIKKDNNEETYKPLNDTDDTNYNIEEEKNVLVHRPLKNFVWGLGQQNKKKKCKIYFLI